MVRAYKRKLGARRYADYSPEQLEECLQAIRSGSYSHRRAAEHFNIPRRTILNKLKEKHTNKVGKPTIFSRDEEESFVSYIETLSDFGFPITTEDLRNVIKIYLERTSRVVKDFQGNKPGLEWLKHFLKRHGRLKERMASNIKRSRAAVTEDILQDYIKNLQEVIKDVPPENIWNLDETNLADDPSKRKVICRRGTKYPEKLCNFSKSSTSVMICGSAAGEILPPFVVYKGTQMWDVWTGGGPKNTRYFSTKSGWFDGPAFNEWFESLCLPRLKKSEGKTVVIADNLSSHLNMSIFEKCRENNISFVCLPPNSTHLTQPLDVAFFRPMKVAWRHILRNWKDTPSGMRAGVLPKHVFPSLLKKLLEDLEPNMKKNLESGFRKTGIFPCDIQPLLDRIGQKAVEPSAVSSAFLELVQTTKSLIGDKPTNPTRRKKVQLPAGKSLSNEEMLDNTLISLPSTSKTSNESVKSKIKKPPKTKSRRCYEDSDEDDDILSEMELNLNESSDEDWDSFSRQQIEMMEEENKEPNKPTIQSIKKEVGTFVVVIYQDEYYPGVIESLNEEGAVVSAMFKTAKGNWKWPEKKDSIHYSWEEIVGSINPPKKVNRRGMFSIPELINDIN